jgi:hypothetical protein
MKHRLLTGSLLVLTFGLPGRSEARPRLGLFGGLQCDVPAVEDVVGFASSCSVTPLVGIAASFAAPRSLRLEAEAAYSRRSFASTAFVTDTDVRVELVELGLLTDFLIHESRGGFRISALGGPELGVVLHARRRFREVDQDISEELRPAEFRLRGALRLTHPAGGFDLFVEGGLAWGLTDLDDTNQQQIHSRDIVFKLGVIR